MPEDSEALQLGQTPQASLALELVWAPTPTDVHTRTDVHTPPAQTHLLQELPQLSRAGVP